MALSTKAIKGRISSVKNTKKITKAMEMVSAAKMRKAVEAALSTRLYAQLSLELLRTLSQVEHTQSPLTQKRPVQHVLVVLVTSNRGLCGSFNANVFKYGKQLLDKKEMLVKNGKETVSIPENLSIDIYGIGKRSALFAKRQGLNLVSVHEQLGERPDITDVTPITNELINLYTEKKYDKIVVVFTHFKSSLQQIVKSRQLLPVSETELETMMHELPAEELRLHTVPVESYEFEPDRQTVMQTVLPRLLDTALYEAILESNASEHSARMIAMKNASEAAGEMINGLTREFNKARQAAITKEIAEISGGAAALE